MLRNLIVVLGDQLNPNAPVIHDMDPAQDTLWMAEADSEANGYVWSHKQRIALFLSAMRHFAHQCEKAKIPVEYHAISKTSPSRTLIEILSDSIEHLQPHAVVMTKPGEWRIEQSIHTLCQKMNIPLHIHKDTHFLSDLDAFKLYAEKHKSLRMEYFYRDQRKQHNILMEGDSPTGGSWNFDKENRKSFGKLGPRSPGHGPGIEHDKITKEVIQLVEDRFADHPGSLDHFAWAVTPEDAQTLLDTFIEKHLGNYGDYQDAMWTDQPWLHHSLISSAMNLKLLDPRMAIEKAEKAWEAGKAPLPAVEGFIRQILGWREYVRNIYWTFMPDYLEQNFLKAKEPLPDFYWTGKTDMACMQAALSQTLEYGYAHHIQRLMVTGLYALLLGVKPQEIHKWYLAIYVDAVEWVELPNTLGMSQFADGGIMASKPYFATGKYIQRMSNYCDGCKYVPAKRTGDDACPFTVLYWDSLQRHRKSLQNNNRMRLQLKNLDRISKDEMSAISKRAESIRKDPP
jgi:deoxyribodipyrimidine photolyase-related protein